MKLRETVSRYHLYLLVLVCLCLYRVDSLGENGNVTDLLEMVQENIAASEAYIIPKTNADLLEVSDEDDIQDYGVFDFIVVGSGAGGGVLANRLTEISDFKVLLLEAGEEPNDFLKIIALYSYSFHSKYNWGDNSTSQDLGCLGMIDQVCTLAHGKALGGSTSINSVKWTRGNKEDYDLWASEYGCTGWSYDDVLPYFIKSERTLFEPKDEAYHGIDGYYTIDQTSGTPGVNELLFETFYEKNYTYLDYNGINQLGVSKLQFGIKGNERASVWTAFLEPFLDRTNLNLSSSSFVTKVLIDNATKTAEGVEFIKDGVQYKAYASKEVILSAGTYNSAQLLMLSGIGPQDELEDLDIDVIEDLPVGKTLYENSIFVGMTIRTQMTIYNLTTEEKLELYIQHEEPYLSAGKVNAFSNLEDGSTSRPLIEYSINAPMPSASKAGSDYGFTDDYIEAFDSNPLTDIIIMVTLLHPQSSGEVTLKSNSIVDKPVINPKFYSNAEDIETLYKGIKFVLSLNETETFQKYGAEVVVFDSPYCDTDYEKYTDDWWRCDIRAFTASVHHPVATNKMGTQGNGTVVSPESLKVYGMENLRIVDASVLPTSISGHTMAPTMMIAEKIADVIKSDYGY